MLEMIMTLWRDEDGRLTPVESALLLALLVIAAYVTWVTFNEQTTTNTVPAQ